MEGEVTELLPLRHIFLLLYKVPDLHLQSSATQGNNKNDQNQSKKTYQVHIYFRRLTQQATE